MPVQHRRRRLAWGIHVAGQRYGFAPSPPRVRDAGGSAEEIAVPPLGCKGAATRGRCRLRLCSFRPFQILHVLSGSTARKKKWLATINIAPARLPKECNL